MAGRADARHVGAFAAASSAERDDVVGLDAGRHVADVAEGLFPEHPVSHGCAALAVSVALAPSCGAHVSRAAPTSHEGVTARLKTGAQGTHGH